ncbi:DNA polymerase III, alpha subunit [Parvularcula bermudensis HTCC2503]|uniref:DNA polymerase III subunit alpha n=1 Tax=Parvularcula bermudensis (strain ATCC BAA-594 / HTCC2503 / KCTC 12087) TaxID=314260 RepID=E0TCR7_PARBH|nr:DNA polymerase III subunit alpha [Parvularcula bermudensis]ADM09856.1 DNA polymerase III, alpha subunit [Parvularcula bermudensis HTCC2503]
MAKTFVHLHLHSSYSLAEGAIPVSKALQLAKGHQMPALAVTDTNNLFGALEVAEILSAEGVQPIPGIELKVATESAEPVRDEAGNLASIVLLAQNAVGFERLMALSSEAFLTPLEGETTGVPLSAVLQRTEGLICLSGGALGPIDRLLAEGRCSEALALLDRMAAAFPQRFYVELQRHPHHDRTDQQGRYPEERALVEAAYARSLPIVATNNVYFPSPADHAAHDALLCIAGGRYLSEVDRRLVSEDHYFKSAEEMSGLFKDLPEAIETTVEVAQRCAFRPRTHQPILPSFAGDLAGEVAELRRQAEEGLAARLADIPAAAPHQDYYDRLERELGIIEKMGFPGYFLIVADFIQWAKSAGIPVGPGRGSGAGSLVAYALTITDLDPLRFHLLFERFLNPERVSMPDFDIDFCQDRRDEVIAYVRDRYGADRVAQIITFGKLQARAVLRDVGRVLQMPFGQVDRLCKMVPNNPANPVTLKEAVDGEPRFREERERDPMVGTLIDTALRLEGLYRHASTHAAGVVIGDRPLTELVPLYRDSRSDMPATQYNMKWVEPAGLVKFDFLGLKTLTVIQRALDFLKADGTDLDISAIPLDDPATYDMLGRGAAIGVFQLESAGMRATLKGLQADCLEDIIALVSLYRPGPMDNIPTYIERKAGREPPDYLHPLLEDVLKETYGVIIYQEQVMQIAQILAGYSLGEADLLRRAMGKKKKEEMDKQKIRFVDGAAEKGVSAAKAEGIFELVAKFAGYGFNKSHAAAYAWVSYQTAYLKANHPAAFLAASMSLDQSLTDKLSVFVAEAKRCGVVVEPPCVNESQADFAVSGETLRYALGALKNVGAEGMQVLTTERARGGPFRDLYDLAERVDLRKVGKRSLEQLARAGAFDALGVDRASAMAAADFLLRYSAAAAEERGSAQAGLFGGMAEGESLARPALPQCPPWPNVERLEQERTALGFYMSGHPLDDFDSLLAAKGAVSYADIASVVGEGESRHVCLAGAVNEVTRRRSKSGKPFAWVRLSDRSGDFEVTVFAELLEGAADLLEPGQLLFMGVTAEDQDGALRLTGESVRALSTMEAEGPGGRRMEVVVQRPEAIYEIKSCLQNLGGAGGQGDLVLIIPDPALDCAIEVAVEGQMAVSGAAKSALKTIDGVAQVIIH